MCIDFVTLYKHLQFPSAFYGISAYSMHYFVYFWKVRSANLHFSYFELERIHIAAIKTIPAGWPVSEFSLIFCESEIAENFPNPIGRVLWGNFDRFLPEKLCVFKDASGFNRFFSHLCAILAEILSLVTIILKHQNRMPRVGDAHFNECESCVS